MKSFMHVAVVCLLWFTHTGFAETQRLTNRNGGVVSSPGYPLFYDINQAYRYVIRGPRNHIVSLHFEDFRTEGLGPNATLEDYLMIVDGRRVEGFDPVYYFGNLPTPFVVLSTTQRLRMRMVTNGNSVVYQGFRATYAFHTTESTCNASNLQGNNTLIRRCNSIANANSTECIVQCRKNYQLRLFNEPAIIESSTIRAEAMEPDTHVSTCVNGTFTKVPCEVIDSVVATCEENFMVGCPYTVDEIFAYYENHRLAQNASFTEEQGRNETEELRKLEQEIIGRASSVCRPQYCHRTRLGRTYIRPTICGRMATLSLRLRCVVCRYYRNKCSIASTRGRV